jgi:uncharacterized protein (TIGR00255 family)
MTGYGEASAQVDGIHYFLEVRSLNNKYFKATIRLAEEFQGLEAEMETLLRTKVTRGTVTLNARCSDASGSAAYQINVAALKRYAEQLRSLSEPNLGTAPLDVGALLALPGVLQPPANEEERFEQARSAFIPLLERALDGLIVMRDREGVSLADDLRAQRIYIAERLTEINRLAPNVVAEYQQRLRQRIEILLKEFDRQVEPSDLVREIAVYAERTDIAEEIKRLEKCEQRPIGRTLDFLAQEMLREANTIASKSPDAEISRRTVEIKGAIDRIKEQCQNVE